MNGRRAATYILTIFAFLFAAGEIFPQAGGIVQIRNRSLEKRKLCVYGGNDAIGVVPSRCFDFNPDEVVDWNRGADGSNFKVRIFKPGLIDDYLYSRDLPGNTKVIVMGEGKTFGYSQSEPKPQAVKYRLKVCNQQYDANIYFTLGHETSSLFLSEGWWNVTKGQCIEIAVSERLKKDWGVEYGTVPTTYYYARTYGDKPLYWWGKDENNELCIHTKSAFAIKQTEKDGAGGIRPVTCVAEGLQKVKFRKLGSPKANEEYYYLTF
ncbi:MAG: DUF1036 domain-containing protein [Pyrinomonadaceae bacterium]